MLKIKMKTLNRQRMKQGTAQHKMTHLEVGAQAVGRSGKYLRATTQLEHCSQ